MTEEVRGLKIAVELDTNKRTERAEFALADYGSMTETLDAATTWVAEWVCR